MLQEGKKRVYNVGKWLRERYAEFLSEYYSERDIIVWSTDSDRTLMSASLCLAGLYPPKDHQIWDESLPWQPIPVHIASEPIMSPLIPGCPKYSHLWRNLFKETLFRQVNQDNKELFEYMSFYTGMNITNMFYALAVRDTLVIESDADLTLPDWTKAIYPDHLDNLVGLAFSTFGYNNDLLKLATGPFFNNTIEYFQNYTSQSGASPKFVLYSSHDLNMAALLTALGGFDYKPPPYGSVIIFELKQHQMNKTNFINIFYKTDDKIEQIHLTGCNFDCELDTFKAIVSNISITPEMWTRQCYNKSYTLKGINPVIDSLVTNKNKLF